MRIAVLALYGSAIQLLAERQQSVLLQTPLGALRGKEVDSNTSAFLGIPYAEPMSNRTRFRQATPKLPWEGARNATACGAKCMQVPLPSLPSQEVEGSEDCLFLNVWAPSKRSTASDAAPLPVLVFIHGGGFKVGAGCDSPQLYDGTVLSKLGLVVVTLNYRLGVFGFLQHPDLIHEDPAWPSYGGMNGISDQILALKWVQQNIAAFGGDPGRVTIWGESAGGESTCDLMSSPLSSGLFHQSIIESGECISGWGPGTTEEGWQAGKDLMAFLQTSTIGELRAMDAATLSRDAILYGYSASGPGAHAPYFVDGHVHTANPGVAWKAGSLHGSALLIGANTADGLLERPYAIFGNISKNMSLAEVRDVADKAFGNSSAAVLRQYPPKGGRFSRPDAALIAAYRDSSVICPSAKLASWATAANFTVHTYFWGSAERGSVNQPGHALAHADEMGAIFGTVHYLPWFTNATALSTQQYWASFTRTGTPTDSSQGVAWPQFDSLPSASNSPLHPYLYFGNGAPIANGNPHSDLGMASAADCAFWDEIGLYKHDHARSSELSAFASVLHSFRTAPSSAVLEAGRQIAIFV